MIGGKAEPLQKAVDLACRLGCSLCEAAVNGALF
jgi:hypothetical protein